MTEITDSVRPLHPQSTRLQHVGTDPNKHVLVWRKPAQLDPIDPPAPYPMRSRYEADEVAPDAWPEAFTRRTGPSATDWLSVAVWTVALVLCVLWLVGLVGMYRWFV